MYIFYKIGHARVLCEARSVHTRIASEWTGIVENCFRLSATAEAQAYINHTPTVLTISVRCVCLGKKRLLVPLRSWCTLDPTIPRVLSRADVWTNNNNKNKNYFEILVFVCEDRTSTAGVGAQHEIRFTYAVISYLYAVRFFNLYRQPCSAWRYCIAKSPHVHAHDDVRKRSVHRNDSKEIRKMYVLSIRESLHSMALCTPYESLTFVVYGLKQRIHVRTESTASRSRTDSDNNWDSSRRSIESRVFWRTQREHSVIWDGGGALTGSSLFNYYN